MRRLRRPRWLYRFLAWWGGYFWLPCRQCGKEHSGLEWKWDGCPCSEDNWGMCTECGSKQ